MLKGALIGVGIAIVGWLIPIAHFVTGPFGPLIGGYIGGQSLENPDEVKAMALGMLMGLFIAALSFLPLAILVAVTDLPGWLLAIPVGAGVYVAGLGAIGALLGTRSARRSEST